MFTLDIYIQGSTFLKALIIIYEIIFVPLFASFVHINWNDKFDFPDWFPIDQSDQFEICQFVHLK